MTGVSRLNGLGKFDVKRLFLEGFYYSEPIRYSKNIKYVAETIALSPSLLLNTLYQLLTITVCKSVHGECLQFIRNLDCAQNLI